MNHTMWERLRTDPGHRTLGELLQEREWAVQEIGRLHLELMRWTQSAAARKQAQQPNDDRSEAMAPGIAGRMLRLKEIRRLTGLASSTIYKYISEGRFPKPLRVSERAVVWRGDEVLAWQESPSPLIARRSTEGRGEFQLFYTVQNVRPSPNPQGVVQVEFLRFLTSPGEIRCEDSVDRGPPAVRGSLDMIISGRRSA